MCSKHNHQDIIHQVHETFFIPLSNGRIHTLQSVPNITTKTPYIRFNKGRRKDSNYETSVVQNEN